MKTSMQLKPITFKVKCTSGYQRQNDYFDYRQFYQCFKRRNTPRDKGYEGFFHVNHLTGSIEETILELIIRDHSKQKFEKRKNLIEKITKKIEVC
jgi:tripeptide aminopeptidase